MKKQIKTYNEACLDMVKLFVKTYFDGADYDFVNNEYDGIIEVADFYFNFSDIKTYLEIGASEDDVFASYDFFYESYSNQKDPKINLVNWLKYPELRKTK